MCKFQDFSRHDFVPYDVFIYAIFSLLRCDFFRPSKNIIYSTNVWLLCLYNMLIKIKFASEWILPNSRNSVDKFSKGLNSNPN